MQLLEGQLILSPSDLTGFIACEHLTQLELEVTRGERERATRDDPELEILFARGEQHEKAHLAKLWDLGLRVVEIEADGGSVAGLEQAAAETIEAMRAGVDVIYQATFFHDGWRGHADFLMRVDRPSDLGAWSYEVADTKLARKAKVPAVMQLCAYSEHVSRIQGLEPELIHLELGTGERESLRVRDFMGYFRLVKARFDATVRGVAPPGLPDALLPAFLRAGAAPGIGPQTYPEPVEHCRSCRWLDVCTERRVADDHLCLVAGMRRDWIRRLRAIGVPTVAKLASSDPELEVDGIQPHVVSRLVNQARMQVEQRLTDIVSAELLEPDPGFGLALLPEPSPGDLFFDMEGDPFAGPDGAGLEYLWGVLEPGAVEGGTWHAFWGHDPAHERVAFEATVDLIIDRLKHDPNLHVYHYANYERNRLSTLAGRYASREVEVDRLLRGEVLVDLYRVVRQGIQVSQDSYSLKKLEPLYMESTRDAAIKEAGSSIVAYERWLSSRQQRELDDIEAYNREDCVSTWQLRDWLETRRLEAMGQFGVEIARPQLQEAAPSQEVGRVEDETAELVARITADIPKAEAERNDDDRARWLLGHLLSWHRREERTQWQEYFRRLELPPEEFIDDREALGGLEYEGVVAEVKQSLVHRYRFPPQENKIRPGGDVEDPATRASPGTVLAIENAAGLIDISRASDSDKPHPRALVSGRPYDTGEQQRSLFRMGEAVVAGGLDMAMSHRAGLSLLQSLTPAGEGIAGGAMQHPGEGQLDAAIRLGLGIRGSYLPIQGPPGSGKTWTAARMIVALVDDHKRVGVAATSHKVISNVLDGVCAHCEEVGRAVPRILQKGGGEDASQRPEVEHTNDNATVDERLAEGEVDVVAGTSWLFSREAMERAVDVIFIDEAGQMSLADALALGQAGRNLVLLGDPQQLAQPSQAIHPAGAGVSALGHVLGAHPTMPPERGIFLATTHRMHPDVCQFISEMAYEGRLHSEAKTARQKVLGEGFLTGTGLRYVPVEAEGNRTSSPEEVEVVAREFAGLQGRTWIDMDSVEKPITIDDILVVAPYNAHVARLTEALPEGARVGTVDKFQGQEAAVVFYSMASSSPDDMPRNLEFLYSLNRLNVAMSRARCLAVLVASPALLGLRARRVSQVRLANALVTAATTPVLDPALR
ncbi:MAG TPA: TM0106 family RecB-like putative nuclease [Candidatus Dormibacteraeota bacterium]|nr:TM0106 family RecB-like putative nuclease [Candidatus Dormibacteraeota bacterium]